MKILVVDNERSVAEMLASALKSEGHDVAIALSGVDGLASIRQSPPDGVFLDLVMPEMTGLDVLRQIRAEWPDLQVVIITGFPDTEALAKARMLGISGVIEKPTVLRRLADVLADLRGERH